MNWVNKVKIEYKILLSIALILLFAVVSAFSLTYYLYHKFYVDRQIETLLSHGHALAEAYYTDKHLFLEKVAWADESLQWNLIYTDNPMLLSGHLPFDLSMGENLISFEERQTLLAGEDLVLIRPHEKFNQDILAVVIPLMENQRLSGALFLYTPLSAMYEPFRPLQRMIIFSAAVLLLFFLMLARTITNHIVGPLKRLTEVTRQIASGDFSQRVSIQQKDELGHLASAFNHMASALEQVDQSRREFLANVSHELRTPISYLKGFNEAFREGMISQEKYMQVMEREIDRLDRLVHDLLDLAQLEGDSYPMNPHPLSFAQLIMELAEQLELKLKEKEITLRLDLDEEIIVYADGDRLEQVLRNVLENALRYSKPKSCIDLRLYAEQSKGFACLEVEDYGEGIPKEHLPKIMERFYRVNKARTRKDGGTGLGLAIAYQIIKKHGGKIDLQSELGKGTLVTITLPLYEID